MKERASIPLLKEHRVSKIIEALKCIDKSPYNREKQRQCILKLYPNKTEKSVFRGMIIPTLRYLGLIVGFGKAIRLSSNGRIIVEAEKKSTNRAIQVGRIVFLEIDKKTFGFVEELKNQKIAKKDLVDLISQRLEQMPRKRKEERINRWLRILEGCKLIKSKKGLITLDKKNYEQAEKELNVKSKHRSFRKILLEEYKSTPLYETAGIVDIPLLRQRVAVKYFDKNMILTESQFDELLGKLPLVTEDYVISLGQPMGAEEKLFHYRGNYYRTLSITFFEEGGKHE